MTDAYGWSGREVVASDGEKIGKVDAVYIDATTGEPEWLAVNTGPFGMRTILVPLQGAQPAGENVRVAYAKGQVKDAPGVRPDQELTASQERELWSHYGSGVGDEVGTVDRGQR